MTASTTQQPADVGPGHPSPNVPPWLGPTTPGSKISSFLRRWMIVIPVVILANGVLGVFGGFILQDTARTTSGSTAPALIEIQDLFASVAEADAAATAAHLSISLSGVEDRTSRNLYLDAIRRSSEQLTVVSAGIGQSVDDTLSDDATGDNPSSDAQAEGISADLANIAASLTDYGGSVEAARLANLNDLPEADDQLREALDVVETEIGPSVVAITEAAQARYDSEAGRASVLVGVAIGLGFAVLASMIWAQYRLAHLVRRVFNPFLLLGTLAFLGFVAMLTNGLVVRQLALDDASVGGYDAVASSARMQDSAFGLQSQLGFLLLESEGRRQRNELITTRIAEADDNVTTLLGAADSEREEAAAEALAIRWARYRDVAIEIAALTDAGRSAEAVALFQGEGLSTFNGVNTAIESVLSDNRTQFADGVTVARSAVERLPWICLALAILAAVLSFVGLQQRLGDYR